jgi:hypothetical protein
VGGVVTVVKAVADTYENIKNQPLAGYKTSIATLFFTPYHLKNPNDPIYLGSPGHSSSQAEPREGSTNNPTEIACINLLEHKLNSNATRFL